MSARINKPFPRYRRICVLLNASSGTADHERVRSALDEVSAKEAVTFELRVLRSGQSIEKHVKSALASEFDIIAAAGGDGTIAAVAAQLRGTGVALGILPQGTFNYVARGLDIPEDPVEAARILAKGGRRPMSVGDVNGRLFLNNASLGLYPAVLKEREGTYKRWGRSRIAAHWSVLKTFARFDDPLRMEVTVDGTRQTINTPLAFIARSAFQLDAFGLEGSDEVRDGKMALFLAPADDRLGLLGRAVRLAANGMQANRDFQLLTGSDIRIDPARRSRRVAMDGETFRMDAPLHFKVLPDALTIVAPR